MTSKVNKLTVYTGHMNPLVTEGSPKERVMAFYQITPPFAQYAMSEIADAIDLPVKKVNGVVTSLLKQEHLTAEERDGTKYFRWTGP